MDNKTHLDKLASAIEGITPLTFKIILAITLLVILVIIASIVYLIYYCFTKGYPRLFSIGHSENFAGYMENYMMDIVNHIHVIYDYGKNNSDKNNKLIKIINALYNNNILPVVTGKNALHSKPLQFNDIPLFYMYYMFRDALASDKDGILAIFRNMNNGQTTIKFANNITLNLYNKSETKVNPDILDGKDNITSDLFDDSNTIESLAAKFPNHLNDAVQFFKYGIGLINLLFNYFKNINDELEKARDNVDDDTYNFEIFLSDSFVSGNNKCDDPLNPTSLADKATINAEISRMTLFLMIFKYYDQIQESYMLRRTGGVSNFTIFTFYMKEYVDYLKEYLEETWNGSELKTRILTWAATISSVFTSDKVRVYMENLPATIAGVNKSDNENYDDKPEVREHFVNILIDMLKSFKSIATLAINLVKVVQAMISVINNPLKCIKLIFAILIGVFLYIIYFVLSISASIWSIAIAAVAVVVYKVNFTLFNLSLFVLKAIIFTVLWVLDYATGGHVLPLLRCENLPNIWYSNPGFANANKYIRQFFCNFSCGSRYNPDGGMCRKIDSNQPSFCPQQLIYNAYLTAYNQDASASKILQMSPSTPDFKPSIDFFTKSDDEKKEILATAYNTKLDYLNNCNKNLHEYDFINRFICYHIDDIVTDPIVKNQLRDYCKFSYCQYVYDKKNDSMPAIEFVKKSNLSCFCQDIYDSKITDNITSISNTVPIYKKILVVLVVIILLIALSIAIYSITIVKPTSLVQSMQLNLLLK